MRRAVLCRRSVACMLLVLLALQAGAEARRHQLCNRDLLRHLMSVCNFHKRSYPTAGRPLMSPNRLTSHIQRRTVLDTTDVFQSNGWRRKKRSTRDFQRKRRNSNEHLNSLNMMCCSVGCTDMELQQGCPYLRF